MTEADWLASTHVGSMLRHLTHEVHELPGVTIGDHPRASPLASDRKLHLFEDVCFAMFGLNLEDLAAQTSPPPLAASVLRCVVDNPWRPVTLPKCRRCDGDGKRHGSDRPFEWTPEVGYPGACLVCGGVGWDAPYRTPTVLALARAAYDNRPGRKCDCTGQKGQFQPKPNCSDCHGKGVIEDGTLESDRLAVLADALEQEGCDNADILSHLRSPGPHVRGCWSVDLLLGRE